MAVSHMIRPDAGNTLRDAQIRQIANIALQRLDKCGIYPPVRNSPLGAEFKYAIIGHLDLELTVHRIPVVDRRGWHTHELYIKDRSPSASRRSPTVLAIGWGPAQRLADSFKVLQFKRGPWIEKIEQFAAAISPPGRQIH